MIGNRRAVVSLAPPDSSWMGAIADLNRQLDRFYRSMVGQGKLQEQQHGEWTAAIGLLQDEILQMRLKVSAINDALEMSLDSHVLKNKELRMLRELGGRRASDR